ncbi:MAG: photosystem I reaction center subunit PsaK [Leptolyngbya sp. SIOISBB]|nr:photosystem I reaction center subunit PsaK [Leptolyngbya sp. SIOISBB]
MIASSFSVLAQAAPSTPVWSFQTALIMITCNLFVIAIGRYAIQKPGAGPTLPFSLPGLFDGFGVPELLATASLGHILGAGMILGLGNAGLL